MIARALSRNVTAGATMSNTDDDINTDTWKASGTTPGTAGVEFAVKHGLGRVPNGFRVWSVNAPAIIYQSTTPWTSTTIFLKCNAAGVAYRIAIE
jgi:hypothetical protein